MMVCQDVETVMRLGREQAWRCMLCNGMLELGSEEVTFVGKDHESPAFPVLVHGECRTGIRMRLILEEFWDTLEDGEGAMALKRFKRMQKAVEADTVGQLKDDGAVVFETVSE